VLRELFGCLSAWLAPVLCFTAEEAWQHRPWKDASAKTEEESVHLRLFPTLPANWRNETLAARWAGLRNLRRVVTGALEIERAEKRIGSSLQAHPTIYLTAELKALCDGLDMAEIGITSAATLVVGPAPAGAFALADVPDVGVVVAPAQGEKCERCWRQVPDRGHDPHHPTLCGRCADAVSAGAAG
jgi:isoleucyl-tRNA synthetase